MCGKGWALWFSHKRQCVSENSVSFLFKTFFLTYTNQADKDTEMFQMTLRFAYIPEHHNPCQFSQFFLLEPRGSSCKDLHLYLLGMKRSYIIGWRKITSYDACKNKCANITAWSYSCKNSGIRWTLGSMLNLAAILYFFI